MPRRAAGGQAAPDGAKSSRGNAKLRVTSTASAGQRLGVRVQLEPVVVAEHR